MRVKQLRNTWKGMYKEVGKESLSYASRWIEIYHVHAVTQGCQQGRQLPAVEESRSKCHAKGIMSELKYNNFDASKQLAVY